jgi:hypothetical protein
MAKGRQSAAGDILTHIFMDHQAAKLRAIENGVRQKLAALVKANPELGKVEILDKDAVRNAEKDNPNVVVFKQGGRAYKITLEGTRGEAVANAFTQRNQLKMEWADKKFMGVSLRGFTRLSGGLATRYSPTFAVRNTTKDNIELANIVYSERGPSPKDVLIDTAGALFGILLIQLIVYFVGVGRKRRGLKSSVNGEAEAAIVSDSLPNAEEDQAHALCAMPPEEDSRVPDEGSPRGATAEEDPSDNREEEVAPCELPPTD